MKSDAVGSDGIPRKFIFLLLPVIQPFLLHLFNSIITTCVFPSAWKHAIIIPVPKNNSPQSIQHFRPIGLLCYLSKAFEFILKLQMDAHFESNDLISEFQSGFRRKYSTTTALIKVSDDIRRSLDSDMVCLHSLLDFSCAFDYLNQTLLLQKLHLFFNFSFLACRLIYSYFSNRTQSVRYLGELSDPLPVEVGVTQGGIWSTGFFSAGINDLPTVLMYCLCMGFADDWQIYIFGRRAHIPQLIDQMNTDLSAVSKWAVRNGLELNVAKTQTIFYSKIPTQIPSPILNECPLSITTTVKNLGVFFDSTFSWEDQINSCCAKIYTCLSKLYCVKSYLSISSRMRVIKSLVLPHFLYALPLFYTSHNKFLKKIRKALNSCTRFIFNIPARDRLGEKRDVLLGMPFDRFLKFRAVVLMYSIISQRHPSYLYTQLQFSSSPRYPRNLTIPQSRTRFGSNSFLTNCASLWNSLPNHIKLAPNTAAFRKLAFEHFSL